MRTGLRRLTLPAGCAAVLLTTVFASASGGTLETIAGTGANGFGGDGGPATSALLEAPSDALALPSGGYLIADTINDRIRRVAPDGTIETIAGTGVNGYNGDGIDARSADLNEPTGIALTGDGGYIIADSQNHRIRKVATDGRISTVAGTSSSGFSGDGGPATSAQLKLPTDVASTADGGFVIADHDNNRVRKVDATGRITTVAGTAAAGYAGDGGDATAAHLSGPRSVAEADDGGILIADRSNNRIRRIAPDGVIATVAGNGSSGFAGDGGPATAARLDAPSGVTATGGGGFLVADSNNHRLRRVVAGDITTLAISLDSDGTPKLTGPRSVTLTADGTLVVAETLGHRVRSAATGLVGSGEPETATTSERHDGDEGSGNDDAIAPPAPPVAGRRLNAEPLKGVVRVRLPDRGRWVSLRETGSIPVGAVVDSRRGAVKVETIPGATGDAQTATLSGGSFRIRQAATPTAVTEFQLTAAGGTCRRALRRSGSSERGATASAARKRRASRRRAKLWAKGNGRFRTRGRHAAATVRGTRWLTEDSCAGTRVRVKYGAVEVRPAAGGRGVVVASGHQVMVPRGAKRVRRT